MTSRFQIILEKVVSMVNKRYNYQIQQGGSQVMAKFHIKVQAPILRVK
jgi:hypothetical protein